MSSGSSPCLGSPDKPNLYLTTESKSIKVRFEHSVWTETLFKHCFHGNSLINFMHEKTHNSFTFSIFCNFSPLLNHLKKVFEFWGMSSLCKSIIWVMLKCQQTKDLDVFWSTVMCFHLFWLLLAPHVLPEETRLWLNLVSSQQFADWKSTAQRWCTYLNFQIYTSI